MWSYVLRSSMTDNLNTLSVSYMLSSKHSSAPQSPNLQYKPHAFQSISTCTVFSKSTSYQQTLPLLWQCSPTPSHPPPPLIAGLALLGPSAALLDRSTLPFPRVSPLVPWIRMASRAFAPTSPKSSLAQSPKASVRSMLDSTLPTLSALLEQCLDRSPTPSQQTLRSRR